MKRIELPKIGQEAHESLPGWDSLRLGSPWRETIAALAPDSTPSEIQIKAIEAGLLTSRRNLLISAPTNSGKSLLAYLAMLQGALKGQRALLLEPLRAISQEKHDELVHLAAQLAPVLGRSLKVTITTGDYRLDEEALQSPPPDEGELVIATPERIEAILRQPDADAWLQSLGTVVVDEAHMLGDPMRGASLEYVVTTLRCQAAPPRFILMSATLGETATLERWLDPADAVISSVRRPALRRFLGLIEKGDDAAAELQDTVRRILQEPGTSVLIFVYQTAWTATLAKALTTFLGDLAGTSGVLCYHSRLSSATRATVRAQFQNGTSRCVVTTAALAMGVNLPATHVIVRDTTTGPGSPLSTGTLLQMMGRAGRGTTPGEAIILLQDGREPDVTRLSEELTATTIPALRSALVSSDTFGNRREPPLAETLLALLCRKPDDGFTMETIEQFLRNSMNGEDAIDGCRHTLRWLSGGERLLAHEQDGVWKATRLGQAAIRGSLPLPMACGIASLMRDIMSVDPTDAILRHMSKLDLLLVMELLASRPMLRKTFSEKLSEQIDQFTDKEETKSIVFQKWVRGAAGFSQAQEIMGSLQCGGEQPNKPDHCRKTAYTAMLRVIVLWQRANGALTSDIERRWDLRDLDEIQEQWRDDRLFLLSAMLPLMDVRCFYFHLKESCEASPDRITHVKRALQRLRAMILQLMNQVGWCSPLGSLFCRMRSTLPKGKGGSPAKATMLTLEAAGITSAQMLTTLTTDDYVALGIRKDLAAQINSFATRARRR